MPAWVVLLVLVTIAVLVGIHVGMKGTKAQPEIDWARDEAIAAARERRLSRQHYVTLEKQAMKAWEDACQCPEVLNAKRYCETHQLVDYRCRDGYPQPLYPGYKPQYQKYLGTLKEAEAVMRQYVRSR
jgi:hypothetical protein